jgi:hypothetical protein
MGSKGGGGVSFPDPWDLNINSTAGGAVHIDSDLDNIHIAEIAPINATSTIKVPDPIVTKSSIDSDADIDLKVEPLEVKTDSKSEIDFKPLAVDSCQTIKLAPLPPIRMEQPYSQHFGFTFMGVELFGFNTSGRYETLLNDPPHPAPPACGCHSHERRHTAASERRDRTAGRSNGGLRIRIADS